ncbi:hypothetical protein GCM10011371_00110 [Novosphingobium marinum]|uniref:DUF2490 domain-containing protein n=1 Tax=Novosphingobium marinum TaxID=1514948 RepID=A0A7Y9XV27_9SPHN|nr:DUF2490 domain-containing protein [Novosphingobium marinum]NYH93703.1 hypothetical protein [Novosphingobium marinum]GGC16678.1 hypothetical protein GCM10011371_00110 [Novosphingobium marinum]
MAAATACALVASPATAANEAFELWLNPSTAIGIDDDTAVEIETAQRFRSSSDGRVDTYFARLWLSQTVTPSATLAVAIERRENDGGNDETRAMQQMSTRHGILRTRLRLEQRFVDNAGRVGLRLRPRLGIGVPLDEAGRWSGKADAELFLTLASTRPGGSDGLTGLRTQIGVSHAISDRFQLGLAYLRQQDFEDGGPDEIAHAPLLIIEAAF